MTLRVLLFSRLSFHRPTAWQRGFWIDSVDAGLTLVGLRVTVLFIETFIPQAVPIPAST